MSLATIAAALADAALLDRFRASAIKSAGAVLTEDDSAPNHAARLRWARRCLASDGDAFLAVSSRNMARFALATNATIQAAGAAATDSDIDYIVSTVILGNAATLAFVTETAGQSF